VAKYQGNPGLIATRNRPLQWVSRRSGGIGRRAGLKIRWGKPRVGSSPTFGIRWLSQIALLLRQGRLDGTTAGGTSGAQPTSREVLSLVPERPRAADENGQVRDQIKAPTRVSPPGAWHQGGESLMHPKANAAGRMVRTGTPGIYQEGQPLRGCVPRSERATAETVSSNAHGGTHVEGGADCGREAQGVRAGDARLVRGLRMPLDRVVRRAHGTSHPWPPPGLPPEELSRRNFAAVWENSAQHRRAIGSAAEDQLRRTMAQVEAIVDPPGTITVDTSSASVTDAAAEILGPRWLAP
jgi:hypothetical protein